MSYLLAGGCSYTVKNLHYGTTFQYDRIHEIWKEADWDIWPEILGKKLNLTPIVYASGGLTNTLILEFIIDHLNQYDKPDMICVQLSDWCRTNIGLNNYIAHWRILQYLYKRNKINWGWMHGECCLGEGLEEDILPVEWSMGDYLINIKLHTEIWKKLSALVDICEYRKIPLYIIQGLGIIQDFQLDLKDENLDNTKKTGRRGWYGRDEKDYFMIRKWDHLSNNTDDKFYIDSINLWFNKMWNRNKGYERFNKDSNQFKPWNYPCFRDAPLVQGDGNLEDDKTIERRNISDNIYSKKLEKLNKESKYINLIGWPWNDIMGGYNWQDRIQILGNKDYLITKDDKIIDYHPGPKGQELFADMFLESNIEKMSKRKNK